MTDHSLFELIFRSCAFLSSFLSLTVVLSSFLFFDIMLSPNRPLSNILFYVSFCDVIASFASSFGFPDNHTWQCTFQAICIVYFYTSSWIWVTMLIYQLRCIVIYKAVHITRTKMHLICWTIPLIVLLLPLSTNPWGIPDEFEGTNVCSIGGAADDWGFFWYRYLRTGSLIICFVTQFFLVRQISKHVHIQSMDDSMVSLDFKFLKMYNIIKWYPIGMLLTWGFKVILVEFFIRMFNYSEFYKTLNEIAEICSVLYGSCVTIIFYATSLQIQKAWKEFLCPLKDESVNQKLFRESSYNDINDEETEVMHSIRDNSVPVGDVRFNNSNNNSILELRNSQQLFS